MTGIGLKKFNEKKVYLVNEAETLVEESIKFKKTAIADVIVPKGTLCQTSNQCGMSYYNNQCGMTYYHQTEGYYCLKCKKTG